MFNLKSRNEAGAHLFLCPKGFEVCISSPSVEQVLK